MQSRHFLEVVLLLVFCPRGNLDVLFIEYAHHPGGNFVVNDGLVVFANDVNAEFLQEKRKGHCMRVTQFSQVRWTYNDVTAFEFKRFGFDAFWA